MTSGTHWHRQDTLEACEKLALLLDPHTHTPEERLRQTSGLTDRLFERAVMDLLNDGRVQRHGHGDGRSTYVLSTNAGHDSRQRLESLPQDARDVHAYLQSRPNTAQAISAALDLYDAEVHRLLNELEQLGLVTIRYVGRLNIYRAC